MESLSCSYHALFTDFTERDVFMRDIHVMNIWNTQRKGSDILKENRNGYLKNRRQIWKRKMVY